MRTRIAVISIIVENSLSVEVLNKLLSDYGEYIMYEMYDFSTSLTDEDAELLTKTENFLFDSKMIDNHVNVKDLFYLSEQKGQKIYWKILAYDIYYSMIGF